MGTIVRIGSAKPKQARPIAAAQRGEQIIEPDVNKSRPLNQIHNRTNTLTDGGIGDSKGLMNASLRRHHVAHLVVLEADYRVRDVIEPDKRLPRLGVAAFALE